MTPSIFPEDVNLTNLPVNPPTGGWAVLNDQAGMGVSLPATVEEFYFNKAPARTTDFDQRHRTSSRPMDTIRACRGGIGHLRHRPCDPVNG